MVGCLQELLVRWSVLQMFRAALGWLRKSGRKSRRRLEEELDGVTLRLEVLNGLYDGQKSSIEKLHLEMVSKNRQISELSGRQQLADDLLDEIGLVLGCTAGSDVLAKVREVQLSRKIMEQQLVDLQEIGAREIALGRLQEENRLLEGELLVWREEEGIKDLKIRKLMEERDRLKDDLVAMWREMQLRERLAAECFQ